MFNENIERFIHQIDNENIATKYNAGWVYQYENNRFIVIEQQKGAEETFSIGQPIFDEDGNLMGYLGIGFWNNLDYAPFCDIKTIPVECWEICLPTKYCQSGAKIYTYWQYKERLEELRGEK